MTETTTSSSPTTYDFGRGPIPAHRHVNPGGSMGGWVADSASVGRGVYVHPSALIGDDANIGNGVMIGSRATIGDDASIGYRASIGSYVYIGHGAIIRDGANIGYYANIGYGVLIHAKTKWITSPPQIHLPHTVLHISRPGYVRSGCVVIKFEEATEDRIREECHKAGYTPEVTEQYVRAVRWMVEGCLSGALYQGEMVEGE